MPEFLLHLVYDNPWNERELDQDNVERIALSIKADGMLKSPLGRPSADQPGAVQLAFGHHRLAAYRTLRDLFAKDKANVGLQNPWAAIPVEVRPIDDRQMARYAIIENHHRSDPSAIEKARALLRLTTDPTIKISQAEAGELFGLGQTGVSHLVHLLDLPADVQTLVASRELPEVPARHLVPLVKWRPDLVSKIAAQAVSDSETGQRAGRVDTLIDEALRRNAPDLTNNELRPWPMEWPGAPLKVPQNIFMRNRPNDGTFQTIPPEVPACTGCPFHLERHKLHYCLRQACFETKQLLWSEREVERVAGKLSITAAAPGEKTVPIYPTGIRYDYAALQNGQRLVVAKLPELRIIPRPRAASGEFTSDSYGVVDLLGSMCVALATVNLGAVMVYLARAAGKTPRSAVPERKANETPAQAERRKVAEVELREERALDRIAYNRSKADVLWLVEHTALLIAERTVAGGGLLALADQVFESRYQVNSNFKELSDRQSALRDQAGIDRGGFSGYVINGATKTKAATPELDALRRRHLAYTVIAAQLTYGYKPTQTVYGDTPGARKLCEELATKTFGIELPAGWDTPPVHHTAINCWTCGRFSAAGAGKLTQADSKAGWVIEKGGAVHCPEHALKGKPLLSVFDTDSYKAPAPIAKPKLAPARTSAQALTQMRAAVSARSTAKAAKPAKPIHVRSHKPAAKKTARRKIARKGR